MKWGVRNGPPYPLGSGQKTGKAKTGSEAGNKGVKVGVYADTILMALSLASAAAFTAFVLHGRAKVEKILKADEKNGINALSEIPKIKTAHTMAFDLAAVNPNYKKGAPYQDNCSYCTAAFELRRRGLDVEARPKRMGASIEEIEANFKGLKLTKVSRLANDDRSKIAQWGEGARGEVVVSWGFSAHIFSVEVVGGKPKFIDPQDPKRNAEHHLQGAVEVWYGRVDNLAPSDKILEAVKKRGGDTNGH
jgi:hypothetical protein